MFCHEEIDTIQRHLFWYVTEQYGLPETRRAVEKSLGFCPAHTRRLVASAPVSTLAAIYEDLLQEALRRLSASPRETTPRAPCPVCRSVARHVQYRLDILNRVADHEAIRHRLSRGKTLCIPHFRPLALQASHPHLLEILTDMVGRDPAAATNVDRNEDVCVEAGHAEEDVPLAMPIGPSASLPSLTYAIGLFRHPDCPLCRGETAAERRFLPWIVQKWPSEASWALDLCAKHMVSLGTIMAPAVRQEYEKVLQQNTEQRVQRIREALTEFSATVWNPLRKSRQTALQGRIEAILSTRPCPVCAYQNATVTRLAGLIGRSLHHPDVRRLYQKKGGVCYRHLQDVLAMAEGPVLNTVKDTAVTHLKMLGWEIHEFLVREDWNRRYEPKGAEQTAPYRAVVRFSGVMLSAPRRPRHRAAPSSDGKAPPVPEVLL